MEKKLYDAAVQGNKLSLLNLLQEDALLLDRFITGRYPETPLHVASMLGHLEFVHEVLARKPELAKEVDSRKSSPLHLAAAKGYRQVAKSLLQVNPDMCLVCDIDGRNPLHIAAMKGHLGLLRELVQVRPWAARVLMEQGETILHACVRCNQLEALKMLVERVSDHEFVNSKNVHGNTILQLAVAAKQTEIINFLITSTTIDVNCENEDGFTALDLLSQNQRDMEEKEIVESLERMEATRTKDKPLSNPQLKAIRTKILMSTWDQSTVISKAKRRRNGKRIDNETWREKQGQSLMLVATLLAAMAFQAGINPPSGVWDDSNDAGLSILAENYPDIYDWFLKANTTGFLASLSIILLLISGLPVKFKFFMWVLMITMWAAVTAMALAYVLSLSAFTPGNSSSSIISVIRATIFVWIGLMLLLFVGHTVRLIIRVKPLRKLVMRIKDAISTRRGSA
ncbi:hypothetical protein V6N13_039039 [Hibiscus sabdariffa]|uniref:PGG domain-containing protein n=1 Tax=Hibiscus sabdariffa TaxID=183260 RepID=A0ABR2SWN2_9ROSI